MDALARKAFAGLVGMFLVVAVLLFGIAWTLDWWQAWLFLAVYFACSIALTLFMYAKDRALLERRMRGGPLAEKEPMQRLIMSIASVGFAGLIIVPALDRRFGWSDMPAAVSIAGDAAMAPAYMGWRTRA
jgi:protein-S-isoprenylcysteine O-methyltransferase Ste14